MWQAEEMLGLTLARLESMERHRVALGSRAAAFGLPFQERLAAATREVAIGKVIEGIKERVRAARKEVEARRRQLGRCVPPPALPSEPPSEARERAAREVVAELLEATELAIKKRNRSSMPDSHGAMDLKVQNEASGFSVDADLDEGRHDDLDWAVSS
ncbi:MAG: hypothetical protein AB1689_23575 [Thermodesulfobacteriota bacterium]